MGNFPPGDERGATPVVGIVLLVAITILLGAVIGQFVFGLDIVQGQDQAVQPQVTFSTDYDDADSELTVHHESGNEIENAASQVTVYRNDAVVPDSDLSWQLGVDGNWDSGESLVVSNVAQDDELRLVWESSTTGDSAILLEWTEGDSTNPD